MIIDAHAHVQLPCSAHLRVLDEAAIERSVLLTTRVHPERAQRFVELRRELGALQERLAGGHGGPESLIGAMQELQMAIQAHPDRYLGFGTVPLGLDLASTESWVQNEVVNRGLRGIGELTPVPGAFSKLLPPVLAAATDYPGLPVMVHGFAPTTAEDLRELAGLARRYSGVTIIVSQLGGLAWMDAVELALATPNIYLEISTVPVVFAAGVAIRELPERTLFGSDAPYGDPLLGRQLIERVAPAGEVRERVLGGNLAQLLGLG